MNVLALVAAFIMTLAFLSYGIGSITLERFRIVGVGVLLFYTMGLTFEISAIILMVLSATGEMEIWHGIIGVIAFLIMLVNTGWVWLNYIRKGVDGKVEMSLVTYTKTAFFIWVVTYLLGIATIIWF